MAGGGSLITVPVMVFMGLPGPVANGTNRIAILAQNLTAIVTFATARLQRFQAQPDSRGLRHSRRR